VVFYLIGNGILTSVRPTLWIAPLFHNFRNPSNIRNPPIYCVNRSFLMFGGSKGQSRIHASMNGILTF